MNNSCHTSTNNSKRILFLSDAFDKPAFNPRGRYFAEYLCKIGYQVDYITEDIGIKYPFDTSFNLCLLPYYKFKGKLGHIEWFFKFLLNLVYDHKNYSFYKKIHKQCDLKSYQAIICSTFNTFPQPLAARLAHTYKIPYIADIRDISEQSHGANYNAHKLKSKWLNNVINHFFQGINIQRRNRALQNANAVTTVSPWHANFLKPIHSNTHLIYNGFDPDLFQYKRVKSDHFSITYTGKIYPLNMQDPTLLFQSVYEIIIGKDLTPQQSLNKETFLKALQFKWYVNSFTQSKLEKWAKEYKIEPYMHYHAYVQPTEIPALLQKSSVLLVLSNTVAPQGPHGIMTTKFFEALGVEKPVLCVRSDQDCLAETIHETNAGLAAKEVEEIKAFLFNQFEFWHTNKYTHQSMNAEKVQHFSRNKQAQELAAILETYLEK